MSGLISTENLKQSGNDVFGRHRRQTFNYFYSKTLGLTELKFPTGYRWELAGSYRSQQESFASLSIVLVVAALLVFLLLGFQFRSLTLPLLIFLTQPVSLASALLALYLTCTFAKNRGCETLGKWVFPNCGLNWCMSGQ